MATGNPIKNKKNKEDKKQISLGALLQEVAKDKGGKPELYMDLLNRIKFHESAHTMNPLIHQGQRADRRGNLVGNPQGPGRGFYQFEGKTGSNRIKDSAVRTKRYLQEKGYEVPKYIHDIIIKGTGDASTLSPQQQDMLALGDLRYGPFDLKEYADGKVSAADVWADQWWIGGPNREEKRPKKIEAWNSSQKLYDNSKWANFTSTPEYQDYLQIKKESEKANILGNLKDNFNSDLDQTKKIDQPIWKNNLKPIKNLQGEAEKNAQNTWKKETPSNNNLLKEIVKFAKGGLINSSKTEGEANIYNTGGRHEQNKSGYQGIPLGLGVNGKMNTVEEDEVSFNFDDGKFIFTNRF